MGSLCKAKEELGFFLKFLKDNINIKGIELLK
jgi:hypothetical protein